MITKINLNKVASYKNQATIQTDKKINLIYGLNGTGKSTFSDFLYKPSDPTYNACSIEGFDSSHEILVYNQTFIQEVFYESEELKGIFSLSKENKEAETKITNAQSEIKRIDASRTIKKNEIEAENKLIAEKQDKAKNQIWAIKSNYSGGDRVLEYCLDGYKGSKDSLFLHITSLAKPLEKPEKSVSDLKNDLQAISGENAQKYSILPKIEFNSDVIETSEIFQKIIVGNDNSSVADFIKQLDNSDWVKKGIEYLPSLETGNSAKCPFCQSKTITSELIRNIKDYFDVTYEADLISVKDMFRVYDQSLSRVPAKSEYESNPKYDQFKNEFELKYSLLIGIVNRNKKLIEEKVSSPSKSIFLESSKVAVDEINHVINLINEKIREHNQNIDQKDSVRAKTKKMFWDINRYEYDSVISAYEKENSTLKEKVEKITLELNKLNDSILAQERIVSEQQRNTVNIDDAIANINNNLVDLGISEFKIQKHAKNLYKISRDGAADRVFRSLSEGEKMIISFLYFIELCKGKKDANDVGKKKVIVIDDPISSLSHIYVFNIGRLIKNEFFGKKEKKGGNTIFTYKYEQVFVLTHSLYFFYEITETKHDERKEMQNLFRLIKNENGSLFVPMSYEEIQNDYQAYWYIIKDEKQPPALIANCMRNIIEYFFNFVEKKDLNNFFLQEPLDNVRYQAFYRYINRESHSLGQNIYDFKEFNYTDFKSAFAALFSVAGYEAHYKKMIK